MYIYITKISSCELDIIAEFTNNYHNSSLQCTVQTQTFSHDLSEIIHLLLVQWHLLRLSGSSRRCSSSRLLGLLVLHSCTCDWRRGSSSSLAISHQNNMRILGIFVFTLRKVPKFCLLAPVRHPISKFYCHNMY